MPTRRTRGSGRSRPASTAREEELYYVRRRYLNPELVRAPAIDIADATFGAHRQSILGVGSTTVASDATHFGAFDANGQSITYLLGRNAVHNPYRRVTESIAA